MKMMGYIETLTKLGCEIKDDLANNVILQSLPMNYELFIMIFRMNGMEKIVAELHEMLKIAEDSIKKNLNHVMMVQKEKKKRKHWMTPKGKGKVKVSDEPSSSKPKTKGKFDPSHDEDKQKKKKGSEISASGINVIEIVLQYLLVTHWYLIPDL
jgi:hypothetical protein